MREPTLRPLAIALLFPALAACGGSPPVEPDDIDLSTVRAGFHCGQGPSADAADACRVLDAFASGGPLTAWPAPGEVQIWLGVDHCVQATATSDYATYQLVYLRAGAASPPLGAIAPARVLAYAGAFGSDQIRFAQMPDAAAALRALATGQPADRSVAGLELDAEGAYRTLVRTRSGRTIGDGPADNGVWFLRSDGTHLLLVGPTIQGGCASELYRVPG